MGVPVALLLFALAYGGESLNIKAQFDEGVVGPTFLPLMLTGIVVTGLLLILIRQWRQAKPSALDDAADESERDGVLGDHRKPALVSLSVLLYVLIFKLLGYVLATVLLAFVLLTLFDYGKAEMLRRLGVAVAITLVFYGLFMLCFSVRLPLLPGVLI